MESFENVPQSVAEVFSRWASFDEPDAWANFLDWEKRKTSVFYLERKIRFGKSGQGLEAVRLLESRYLAVLRPHITQIVSGVLGGAASITEPQTNVKSVTEPPVDFHCLAVLQNNVVTSVAVLTVGPYRNPSAYARRRYDWLQKAFALAWLHETIIMVLPDDESHTDFSEWVAEFRSKCRTQKGDVAPVVHVVLAPADARKVLSDAT